MEAVSPTDEIVKRQQKLAANRERVRRYRLKHNPPPLELEPRKAPMSNPERTQNFCVRKRLQTNSIHTPTIEPPPRREPKEFPSKECTRAYRPKLQNQHGQPKRIPFSNRERAQRFYAKKQQIRLKTAMQMRAAPPMSPGGSNIEEVCDLIQI